MLRQQPGPASLRAYRREVREPVDRSVTEVVVRWITTRVAELS
ncbi:hypothetical protein ABZ570_32785 [Micromonospora sp. NPDC007271]